MQRGNVLNSFHSITLQFVQEFLIQTMPVCFLQENQNVLVEDRLWATLISFINYSRQRTK